MGRRDDTCPPRESPLTAWELARLGIPATVLVDGAARMVDRLAGEVDCVIVGADPDRRQRRRGQQNRHLLARRVGRPSAFPFYVAGPPRND